MTRPAAPDAPPAPAARVPTSWSVLAAAAGGAALAVAVRWPALHQPLDRDMGAHAAVGALWADGLLPYVEVIDNKQPLAYVTYAVISLVRPHSTAAVRLAGFLVAAAAVAALVVLGSRIVGTRRAAVAGAVAATVGATRWVQGVDLNTEHLLVLTGTLAVLVPLAFPNRRGPRWLLMCGGLVGLAALSKAPGALLIVPALAALLLAPASERSPARTIGWVVLGACAVGLPFAVGYAAAGHLDDLVFWNLTYNLAYSAGVDAPWWRWLVPGPQARPVVLLAFAAVVLLVRRLRSRGDERTTWTLLAWIAAAYVGARIGGRDFPHYFAPLVPPVALALMLPRMWAPAARGRDTVLAAAAAACLVVGFGVDVAGQLGRTPDELADRLHRPTQAGPWHQHEEVGAWLREHATAGDRLYVVGNEPGFYWSSGLAPATPHIVAFPSEVLDGWTAEHDAALAATPPRWVVQPYDAILWPDYAASLEALPYEAVARFGPVTIMELHAG